MLVKEKDGRVLDKARMKTQFMPDFLFIKDVDASHIEDIMNLYISEGWWQPGKDAPELVRGIVCGSHCFLAVIEAGHVIGMGRAISDGCSDAYIQDVTVAEKHRGLGIGSGIIKALHDRLYDDGIRWIGLIAEKNSRQFYEKQGFVPLKDDVPMLKTGF